ncbi:hypothetical protein ACFSQD_01195 [Flavihumibacter stibioxidans]|uniref:hypothetical protein n=1 Tax=Flavihumibacter stibioxidans TaxID=1834163 RepID=UPI00164F048C|nr:hypothetical protein [Flavihumibacter stibioxidans]
MELLIYTIAGLAIILLVVWTFRVNMKERSKLTDRLNKDFPHHEKHKEAEDPDDVKGD